MNCLRLNEGMEVADFMHFSGVNRDDLMSACEVAIAKGLITIDTRVKATDLGLKYLNSLLESLLDL